MTEAEWIALGDAEMMIVWLPQHGHDPHARKDQLLAVACCRRLWDLLSEVQREAVEAAERIAEGGVVVAEAEWRRFLPELIAGLETGPIGQSASRAIHALLLASFRAFDRAPFLDECASARGWDGVLRQRPELSQDKWLLRLLSPVNVGTLGEDTENEFHRVKVAERCHQCLLVAEMYGHLFHGTRVNPVWLAWNDGTIPKLARCIYDERAFDHLPILADALEEAGCDDSDILAHCRRKEGHVRGCWVVDLLLGER